MTVLLKDSTGRFNITTETCTSRPYSSSSSASARTQAFRNAVRNRDGRCVITDRIARLAHLNSWRSFEAAHIFPRSLSSSWNIHNFGVASIDSVQNGLLLDASVHQLFNSFAFSIDTTVIYKYALPKISSQTNRFH